MAAAAATPWLLPALGAAGGAIMNKDDPLKGAALGGLAGFAGGQMLPAAGGLGAGSSLGGAAAELGVAPVAGGLTNAGISPLAGSLPAGVNAMGLEALNQGGLMGSNPGLSMAQVGAPGAPGLAPVSAPRLGTAMGAPHQMGLLDALKSSGQALGEVMSSGKAADPTTMMMMGMGMGRGEQPMPAPGGAPPPLNPGAGGSFMQGNPYQAQQEEMLRRLRMGSGLNATSRMV